MCEASTLILTKESNLIKSAVIRYHDDPPPRGPWFNIQIEECGDFLNTRHPYIEDYITSVYGIVTEVLSNYVHVPADVAFSRTSFRFTPSGDVRYHIIANTPDDEIKIILYEHEWT